MANTVTKCRFSTPDVAAPQGRRHSFLMVATLLAGSAQIFAATIHVPADKPTIQAGIDAAAGGDIVLVAKGTYHENIDFNGKNITVISSDGPAQTIIQGDGTSAVVAIHTGETRASVLNGFTISGGGARGHDWELWRWCRHRVGRESHHPE